MTVTTLPTAHAHAHALAPQPTPVRAPDVVYVPAPDGTPSDAPRIFAAINGVMRDAMPVGKTQENKQQNYNFRGIDDVMSAMAGPMRTHGVFILPTIAEHKHERDGKMTRTLITMRYRVYGPAGDCLVADVPGEAFDFADKSTNKAQSAALKYLLFTLFMLPVDGRSIDDGDRHHPEPTPEHRAEQQQRQQGRQQRGQGQQRQQRQQQPRRSNRAEAGPWEQPAPAQQEAPRLDYLAEAKAAPTPKAFATVRAAAAKAGAPADYLAALDQIAAKKREAAQKPNRAPAGPAPHSVSDAVAAEGALGSARPAAEQQVDQEQAAALGEFYDAARSAGVVDRAEADQLFNSRHGGAPAAATAAQLRDMRDDLLDAAKGASA